MTKSVERNSKTLPSSKKAAKGKSKKRKGRPKAKHENNVKKKDEELPKINLTSTDLSKVDRISSAPMRKISLPQIESIRSMSVMNGGKDETKASTANRRISLPALPVSKTIISQILKIDNTDESCNRQTRFYQEEKNEDKVRQLETDRVFNATSLSNENNQALFSNQRNASQKMRRSSVNHASVYTPASQDRRRSMLLPREMSDVLPFSKSGRNNKVEDSIKEHDHDENNTGQDNKFLQAAKVGGKAAMFAKLLADGLNARYYHATLNDPDYNDKYERNPTPELVTDEESESAILNDFAARISDCSHSPEPETPIDKLESSDSASSQTDDEAAEEEKQWESSSTQSSIRAHEVPEEIKDLVEFDIFKKEEKPDDMLLELGIWKPEDFNEHENEADDEESESDWSIKTFEENIDDNEILDFPSTPPPEPPPEPPPKTPPHVIRLPVGDTPEILHSPTPTESESSSSYSIYASDFDEYESDVFGSRLQENIFYIPPSAQSDAGDSDMFYCVPMHNMQFESSSELLIKAGGKRRKDATENRTQVYDDNRKVQKRRKRKELDEKFVAAFMEKHRVHDATIVQYGGATKAFRLRMAKAGKDPEAEDKKRNARIEKRIRRRLEKGHRKRKKITKENLVKLPNISKWAKVMRWVGIQRARQCDNMNVILENGWMDNAELETSLRFVEGTQRQQHKKKDSVGLKSYEGEENGMNNDQQKITTNNEDNRNEINKNITESDKNSFAAEEKIERKTKKKKKKFRKRRKVAPSRKIANHVPESEESFVIKKYWQINPAERKKSSQEIDDEEEDECSPRSNNSVVFDQPHSVSNDSSASNLALETPPSSPEHRRWQIPTPESEAEPEKEAANEDEHQMIESCQSQSNKNQKSTAMLNWKLLRPTLKIGMRREQYNRQIADMTRILFSQLTLKAKEYAKLPPIRKKSRASSFATFRSTKSRSKGELSSRNSKQAEE